MQGVDCPNEQELRALLLGELPEPVVQDITRHLETCPRCEEVACRLDAVADPFLCSLRLAVEPGALPQPTVCFPPATASAPSHQVQPPPELSEKRESRPFTLPGYEVLGELGRGGMSVVYQARQLRPARLVALKVLLDGSHAGADQHARFLAEADALARLQHPHIVQVFEVGRHGGLPFLVLEYMPGGGLAQRLGGFPQPAAVAARLVESLAQAVHYAHTQGVIHRDLKPANVLLTEDGTAKVSDFGLAKHERPDLTATGAILGTPSYMAPEQAAGDNRATGPAADVHALGAILYELLTGRPPFRSATVLETLEQVRTQEPVPPSQIQASIPRDLSTVCLKCLHKEPCRRYGSARELAEDLRRHLDGKPILARPIRSVERAWRWARRNPGWAVMFISFATLLVVMAVGGVALSVRALKAEAQTKEKLFESRLAEARALSLSRRSGQRFASLALLDEAGALARELHLPPERFHDLRNATIAALVMPDLYPERTWDGFPDGSAYVVFDDRLEVYARTDMRGNCSVRRVEGDEEMYFLPTPGPVKGESRECWPFLSPGARIAAVRQADGKLHFWKLDQPRPEVLVQAADGFWVDFRPDGHTAAISHVDGAISHYDLATGQRLSRLAPDSLTREVFIALHPQEPLVAVASYHANVIQVRDLRTGDVVKSIPMPHGCFFVAWHPAGHTLAASDGDGTTIHLFDRTTFRQRGTLETRGPGSRFFFNHLGDRLAVYGWKSSIELFDVFTGQRLFEVRSTQPTLLLRFSRDDRRLAGFQQDNQLGFWQVGVGRERRAFVRQGAPFEDTYHATAVSPESRLLGGMMNDGIGLWDLDTGAQVAFLPLEEPRFVQFEPGPGGALLTGSRTGVYRWPVHTNRGASGPWRLGPPQPLALPPGGNASVSRDGSVLAVASRAVGLDQPWAGVWVLRADRPADPIHLAAGKDIRIVALSHDGHGVVAAEIDRTQLWDGRTGELKRTLLEHISHPDFSPDGRLLALGLRNNSIGRGKSGQPLLETETWGIVRDLSDWACFAPDGRTLLVGTNTTALRLVEAATGRELVRLESPELDLPEVTRFTPDGTRLITTDGFKGLHVCDLRLLRAELARRGLDWDAPAFEPSEGRSGPLQLQVDWGDYDRLSKLEIVKNYDRAVEAAPHLAIRWYLRGQFHWRAGRYKQASADLRKAMELEPNRARFCNDLARLYVTGPKEIRDGARTVTLAERAVQLSPGEWDYHNTLGIALYRAGRYDEAVAVLEKSLKGHAGQADAQDWYFLAMCHYRLGHVDKAQDCFRNAVAWRQARGKLTVDIATELDLFEVEARTVLKLPPLPNTASPPNIP